MKRMSTRLLVTTLCVALLMSLLPAMAMATEASTPKFVLTLPDSITAGDTVTATVSVQNNPGIAGGHIVLTYNKNVFSIPGGDEAVTKGEALSSSALLVSNTNAAVDGSTSASACHVVFANKANMTDNGILFTVSFKVAANAEAENYTIGLTYITDDTIKISDTGFENVVFSNVPGSVTVNKPVSTVGDINGDGNINMVDGLTILQAITGTYTLSATEFVAADINGDDKVNMVDGLTLLQYIAGSITELRGSLIARNEAVLEQYSLTKKDIPVPDITIGTIGTNGHTIPGNTITIPVSIDSKSFAGASYQINIQYDNTVMTYVDDSIDKGSALSTAKKAVVDRITTNVNEINQIGILIYQTTGANFDPAPQGEFFTLQFKINANAKGKVCTFVPTYVPENTLYNDDQNVKRKFALNCASGSGNVVIDVDVDGVTINDPPTTIAGMDTRTLTASVSPDNADHTVTWSSSDPSTISINETTGELKTLKATTGTPVRITATTVGKGSDGNAKTATCDITVTDVKLTGLTITDSDTPLVLSVHGYTGNQKVEIPHTGTMVATKTPDNAISTITWSSDNTNVATVDATTGVVTGVAEGTAIITATGTNEDSTLTTMPTRTVNVITPVDSLAFDETSYTIDMGGASPQTTWQPTFTLNGTTGQTVKTPLTFTCEPNDVVSVAQATDGTGTVTVTALKNGTATITATSGQNSDVSTQCTVTVNTSIKSLAFKQASYGVSPDESSNTVDLSGELTIDPSGQNEGITWLSSNTAYATVGTDGVVTGLLAGLGNDVTITAQAKDHSTVKATTTVKITRKLTAITLTPNTLKLAINPTPASQTLTVNYQPSNTDQTGVTWSSDDQTIAKVEDGVVTAVKVGTTKIKATSSVAGKTSIFGECSVTVANVVESVTVAPDTLAIEGNGQTKTLTVTVLPAIAPQSVTWESSVTSVATVSDNAGTVTVTSVGPGTATITATSTDDETMVGSCAVTVTPALTGVTLNKDSIKLTPDASYTGTKYSNTETLTATRTPEGSEATLSWSTSNDQVATVVDGLVTGVGVGTATITVKGTNTETGTEYSATCAVSVQYFPDSISIDSTKTLDRYVDKTNGWTPVIGCVPDTANKSVTLSVKSGEPTDVVTINGDNVSPAKNGTTTIVATSTVDSSVTAECIVTVSTKVTSIEITISGSDTPVTTQAIEPGGTVQFAAKTTPSDPDEAGVNWTSDHSEYLSVAADGTVTASAKDTDIGKTAVITATAKDGKGATKTVNVKITNELQRISIEPNPAEIIIPAGATVSDCKLSLSIAYNPELTTDSKIVTWDSTDKIVATVVGDTKTATETATAVVTAVAVGKTTIKATSAKSGIAVAECELNVYNKLTRLTLTNQRLEILLDSGNKENNTLKAQVEPASGTKPLSWSSDATNIVEIGAVQADGSYKLIAKAPGTANIRIEATDGSGLFGTCVVTVKQKPTSIAITNATADAVTQLKTTDTGVKLDITYTPANADKDIDWTYSEDNKVVVEKRDDGYYYLKPLAVTTSAVTVTGKSHVASSVEATLLTNVRIAVTGITVNPTTAEMYVGDVDKTITTVTFEPAAPTINTVAWSSDNTDVATVDPSTGVVHAVKAGTANIKATTTDGGFTATCALTVKQHATSVAIQYNNTAVPDPLQMYKDGKARALKAVVSPDDASDKSVIWTVTTGDCVTVSDTGVVTPVAGKTGTAVITVTTTDGSKTAVCNVKVDAEEIKFVSVTPASASINAGRSTTLFVSVITQDGHTLENTSMTWASSNSSVASVSGNSQSCTVTGGSSGTATITASFAADTTKTGSCAVTVVQDTPVPVPTTCIVKFVDWDGTELSTQFVQIGGSATAPADPKREGYTFTGWDKDFSRVYSSMLVTAQYTDKPAPTAAATVTPEPTATPKPSQIPGGCTDWSITESRHIMHVGDTWTPTCVYVPHNTVPGNMKWLVNKAGFVSVNASTGSIKALSITDGSIWLLGYGTMADGNKRANRVEIIVVPNDVPTPTPTITPVPTASATPTPTGEVTPTPTGEATPTPTGTVTPAPTATATPEPTRQPVLIAYVRTSGGDLNLRSGAGTSYDRVVRMPNGSKVEVLERGAEWSKVRFIDRNGDVFEGWASNEYLEFVIVNPTAEPTVRPTNMPTNVPTVQPSQTPGPVFYAKVITSNDPLNMRATADGDARIITKVPRGEYVTVIARGNTWTHCTYNGYEGYCATRYLEFVEAQIALMPSLDYEGAPEPSEEELAALEAAQNMPADTDVLPDDTAFDDEAHVLVMAFDESVDMCRIPDGGPVVVAGAIQTVKPGEEVALRAPYFCEPKLARSWILIQTRDGVLGYLPEDLFSYKAVEDIVDSEIIGSDALIEE